ncbi:MAG: hypothetical protein ACRC77_05950 [Bacteroidales bacterium]
MKALSHIGRILVGIGFLFLAFVHFKFADGDAKMVPSFLPFPMFWVYFIGACWGAAGISFITNIMTRLSGLLAALLVFVIIFLVQLKSFTTSNPMDIITLAFSLGLIGACFMISAEGTCGVCKKEKKNQ